MRTLVALALCFAIVIAHGDHDHHHHDHDHDHDHGSTQTEVVTLTDATFDDHIKNNEVTLVEFYAPWCGHCKALAPEYDKASILLKDTAKIAKVDCTVHKDLCSQFGVQGFPTLKMFTNDGMPPTEYDQARKADAIVKFVTKQKQPAFITLATQTEFDKFKGGDVAFLCYLNPDDKDSNDVFTAVAKVLRNEYDFARIVAKDLQNAHGITTLPSCKLFKNFDEPELALPAGTFDTDTLVDFISSNAFPIVGTIGPENYQKYLDRGLPLVWVFVDFSKEEDKALLKTVAEVAKNHKSELSFVQLDGVRWAEHSKTFGLSGVTPGIAIEDRENRKNYVFPQTGAYTAEALEAHAAGFLAGTLSPTVKSEPIPASNDGPVKVVVGKSFDSIVLDTTKDVLVEFYAPWCGHCKSLAPKYEKLGEMFKDTKTVVVAKVDATENDTPADIKGFPTLIFYPANDKQNPITYDGERSENAMAQFIRDNAFTLKGDAAASGAKKDEL
jgi:protein disulfide-isomerase A1